MGRVEDALKRAAEEAVLGRGVSTDGVTDGRPDPSFPAEHAGRVSNRDVPAPAEAPAELEPVTPALEAPSQSRLVEMIDATLAGKLVADQTMAPGCREQYRRLAATLHHTQATSGLKAVMIASAVAGEGKTLTAANLALTFSESYKRTVLLIDADLRRPSLHRVFKIEPTPGLSDGLMAASPVRLPIHRVSARLSVLPAGRPTSDPMAGLTSDRMRQLVAEAREAFDWIIIDTPPVGLMTDANLLAAITDGTLLVVKAGTTPYQAVQRAVAALGPGSLLGAVLNRATFGSHDRKKYYEYYYAGESVAVGHD